MRARLPATVLLAASMALVLSACGSSGSHGAIAAVSDPSASTIVSQGTGTVSGSPDTMTVGIGVQTSAPHASEALSDNNSISASVQRVLERDGVAANDIQTSNLSLYENQTSSGAVTFDANDSVTATVHDIARAGTIIDEAVAAAGDSGQLQSVSFSISDTSPLMAAARQQAVAAARADAQQLASAAGEKVVALQSLSEVPQQTGCEYTCGTTFSGSATARTPEVPVQPGTQQLSLQVTATWTVAPAPQSSSS